MIADLGWIFLAASGFGEGTPFVPAQAYAHHLQATWAELDGDLPAAHENLALARLYDERSPSLARAEMRLAQRIGAAPSEPLPAGDPLVSLWKAASTGDWARVRRGLARRVALGAPNADDVALVAALAEAGHGTEAARLAAGWAGPGRRLPRAWWGLLDAGAWRAWAEVDDREAVAVAALRARWREGAWTEVEAAAIERLRRHPGSISRIGQALRWAGAFDPGLARELFERWRRLQPEAADERALVLLAAGFSKWVEVGALTSTTRLRVDLAAGRWAGAAGRWRADMPAELGLALGEALAEQNLRPAALALLATLELDAAFVLRARLLAAEPERLQALLATAEPTPARWGAWALLDREMPSRWTEAERVQAAWSARGDGPPPLSLVEAVIAHDPDQPEALAWMAVLRGGRWLDMARRQRPDDPRVLEAELRWTSKPDRWVEWALRRHPRDRRLLAAVEPGVGPRAEASEP